MENSAVRSFAVFARKALIGSVSCRAAELGVSENGCAPPACALTETESDQLRQLSAIVAERGFEPVMEEAAYTWFNRFIALRFMEVNGYLPSGIRVFSGADGGFSPEILENAQDGGVPGADISVIRSFMDKNDREGLYKYLILCLCSELNRGLPDMFEEIGGWTELLFPVGLLLPGSVAERLVTDIPEEDWLRQVQMIGWLYQYYNSEPKDRVFAELKGNVKINADTLPAATQLFTPDWIVHYLVENSLGRLWLEGHDDSGLRTELRYFLEDAPQEDYVRERLDVLSDNVRQLAPEKIKIIDPCMGSGHILICAFDVLMKIYLSCGWQESDAARSIVENNLCGLDVDKRVYQLAYFALMMKARQYDSHFLEKGIRPEIAYFSDVSDEELEWLDEPLRSFAEQFCNARLFGSLLDISLPKGTERAAEKYSGTFWLSREGLDTMLRIFRMLSRKYDVVVTNPPYMGHWSMNAELSAFVKKKYPESKTDLFACFIEKCARMTKSSGYYAMITQQAWMFLSSYQGLRRQLLGNTTVNMAHLGTRAFDDIGGEVVQTAAFVNRGCIVPDYRGVYIRLSGASGERGKEELFLSGKQRFFASKESFMKIPGAPVAYDLPDSIIRAFASQPRISDVAQTRLGMTTADNGRFTRLWFEPDAERCIFSAGCEDEVFEKGKKWVPYNKGGKFRKWYGNLDFVVNWEDRGREIRNFAAPDGRIRSTVPNTEYYFRECATWSKISAGTIGFRYRPAGSIFDVAGACLYADNDLLCLMGFLNSCVAMLILRTLSPTLNYEGSHIAALPVLDFGEHSQRISELVEENIAVSREDWDSFETSWDFSVHPLI